MDIVQAQKPLPEVNMPAKNVGDQLNMLVRSLNLIHGDFYEKKEDFAQFYE